MTLLALGRGFPLNYRIQASVVISITLSCKSDFRTIKQDEKDQCRQEYIDMRKKRVPARKEFVDAGTYQNPGSFPFAEINSGDYTIAIFTIADHLQKIRAAIGNQLMKVNSGYRSPMKNTRVKGAKESQHIYGVAVDIALRDFNGDGKVNKKDWDILANAAKAEGATFIESFNKTPTWCHMDWR